MQGTKAIGKIVASSILIGATYFGLTQLKGSRYGQFLNLDSDRSATVVDSVRQDVDTASRAYQQNLASLVQLRKNIDALLPPAELEKMIAEEVASIQPSALKPFDVARIVKYAADNNVFTADGNRYAAARFCENLMQGGR